MEKQPPERLLGLQRRFADHLRDPKHKPPPDAIEERRLAIYRRLVFNNLSSLFARNFPVIRKLHSDEQWRAMIRDFLIEHRSTTPMFTEIGSEFVGFLAARSEGKDKDKDKDKDPAWLPELAHWEYLETCVRLAEEKVSLEKNRESRSIEALMDTRIRMNPTLRMAQYQWPVHRIGPDYLPEQPNAILLAVYRRANDQVAFMQINALTASLLEMLAGDNAPVLCAALDALAERFQQSTATVHASASPLIASLIDREVMLGPQ